MKKSNWSWWEPFAIAFVLGGFCAIAHADPLVWQTPYGQIGLPFEATEALIGYDAVQKQAIGGMSVPFYTDPKGIIAIQVGAIAPWPIGNQATIQPYLAAGHDILKEIPSLNQYQSLHLNIFGRYDTALGRAGVGLSFSYSFASPSVPPKA
jgi:hypothetical protein